MLRPLLLSCLVFAAFALNAGGADVIPHGRVVTDTLWSPTLGVQKRLQVYLPPDYDAPAAVARRYPLVVYLHGRWGDETDLVAKGHLAQAMDSLIAEGMPPMIVAMPDGDDGWWMTWAMPDDPEACRRTPHREEPADRYCVRTQRYDEYVATDILTHIDSTFRTHVVREARGIAGLSMGGYGAVTIAARYPELFSVAVSHDGILSPGLMADSSGLIRNEPVRWRLGRTAAELQQATGFRWPSMYPQFGVDGSSWLARDPVLLLEQAQQRGAVVPELYIDVARSEEAARQNRLFRERIIGAKIPITYSEWPGKHAWDYWRVHVPDGLQFLASRVARPTLASRHPASPAARSSAK
jgi:S-formylglutathione hydrolase FrmB